MSDHAVSNGSEIYYDAEMGAAIVNETTIPNEEIWSTLSEQQPELASLARWGAKVTRPGRAGGLFDRDRFASPNTIFDQFKVALDAAETDDVVSNAVETTESLAFNNVRIDSFDENEETVWNQIAKDMQLKNVMRQMWRELFVVSQCYVGIFWGQKSYKAKGRTKSGMPRRKQYTNLVVPRGLTVLDPLKVLPIGNFMFGREELAWVATKDEATNIDDVLAGKNTTGKDPIVSQLFSGRIELSREDKKHLKELTGASNLDYLFKLDPKSVFRHTATRPDYARFANVRMRSVFELLDLKQQLRQLDRAYLLGGTNFIILVKKGSDKMPAKDSEVQALAGQIRASARVPVIIGDHRIDIEIITPRLDMTLRPERHDMLDMRIMARMYQVFNTGAGRAGSGTDDSLKLSRVIAKGMEGRRSGIGASIQEQVLDRIFEMNASLTEEPKLMFSPKRIALDFDPTVATYMQDLRDRGDISRDTILAEQDLDQEEEAQKRRREKENGYDKLFTPTNTSPGAEGRRLGGNKNGGGMNPKSFENTPQPDNRAAPGEGDERRERDDARLETIEAVQKETDRSVMLNYDEILSLSNRLEAIENGSAQ